LLILYDFAWLNYNRGELKLVSHGRKMNKMGAPHPRILPIVELSGLTGLVGASYETVDKGLLCAFVERWHEETNSFHLSVGELTITLDDVLNLSLDAIVTTNLLVDLLCVDLTTAKIRHFQSEHVRLS